MIRACGHPGALVLQIQALGASESGPEGKTWSPKLPHSVPKERQMGDIPFPLSVCGNQGLRAVPQVGNLGSLWAQDTAPPSAQTATRWHHSLEGAPEMMGSRQRATQEAKRCQQLKTWPTLPSLNPWGNSQCFPTQVQSSHIHQLERPKSSSSGIYNYLSQYIGSRIFSFGI